MKKTFIFIVLTSLLISCLVGGIDPPHSSPKSVVQAFVDASVAKDCERVASLISPGRRDNFRVVQLCGGFASARIDHMYIKNGKGAMTGKKMITLVGSFELALDNQPSGLAYELFRREQSTKADV